MILHILNLIIRLYCVGLSKKLYLFCKFYQNFAIWNSYILSMEISKLIADKSLYYTCTYSFLISVWIWYLCLKRWTIFIRLNLNAMARYLSIVPDKSASIHVNKFMLRRNSILSTEYALINQETPYYFLFRLYE